MWVLLLLPHSDFICTWGTFGSPFFYLLTDMSFPTYAVSTELDAVNQILSSVGQAPVTTLNLQNPEVAIPVNTLREVSRMVQLEGWTFNVERKVAMQPDSNTSMIVYPTNILSMDANEEKHYGKYDLVRREGFLYDRYNHTYKFTETIYADVVYYFDYQHLPPAIQAYITARAARMCAVKMVGDAALNQMLMEQEQLTRAYALDDECNQGDYNIFGFRDGENYYQSYQPFRGLMRQ